MAEQADGQLGVVVPRVLPGGGVIEVDGSTVADPQTGEPVPAVVLRLPVWRLAALAGALDMWNRVQALVEVGGRCVPADDGLGAALTQAAETLTGSHAATSAPDDASAERSSWPPDEATARRMAVRQADNATSAWVRVVTGSPLVPVRVVTALEAASGRLTSGEDVRDPAAALIHAAMRALADTGTDTASRPWPPPWFGAIHGSRTDTATSGEEQMQDGFGQ
jgi:hypothetical protein